MENFTVWFTGLSGAGKSTLALKLERYLMEKDCNVQLLDGDIVREEIGSVFGYERTERIKMAKVLRLLAKLLNKKGITVIVAAIAPYEEIRQANRERLENYIEIFVECSIKNCIERDVKKLYQKAFRGEVENMIGVDDIYETPQNYDVKVNTSLESIEESFNKIKEYIEKILQRKGTT
ncbi:adenylyl-sulfate kinase [Aneurinibacillus migulanus]|uniref:Adenylyl-sulfate kinase n=1 Tax=Aneurinibacillus migulanus TaxID=47500 RepID=A0A0D1W1U2_ANEMI|nr:adenylyl-sulfate kinase [Aneurinibacillus migulanus]KIV52435.1 hypothetical protein TS65_23815 [Aneurinibacillus migulanus]KON94611.1 hypothetical protein AF333_02995 [Aneurinibacillus migulanus]MED0892659.1 adenylyl-sulfate kinase [Aneurinibacillus migulanus]MED1614300.1 adenylyl-sulfate kinase [Aneurinibacillus migulanus]SDI47929.1 adenylylsulfate kinase [Aneurinibacillus migulanus]